MSEKKVKNAECLKNGRKKRNNPFLGSEVIQRYSKNCVAGNVYRGKKNKKTKTKQE